MMKRLIAALFFLALLAPGLPVAQAQDEAPAEEVAVDEDGNIVDTTKPIELPETDAPQDE